MYIIFIVQMAKVPMRFGEVFDRFGAEAFWSLISRFLFFCFIIFANPHLSSVFVVFGESDCGFDLCHVDIEGVCWESCDRRIEESVYN